jgi:high affinity Mn2+ porin
MHRAVRPLIFAALLLAPALAAGEALPPPPEPPATSPDSNDKQAEKKNGNGEEKKDDKDKDDKEKKDDEDTTPKWLSAHGQSTVVTQGYGHFNSPYTGPLSLKIPGTAPFTRYPTTATADLFLAAQPWAGTLFVFNPEMAGGTGISQTNGIAGFPNGEATRVGAIEPTPFFARVYLQQTFGLGGEQETVADGPNQVAGTRDVNRITVRLGKMAAGDILDDNTYSHDPRVSFMNWGLMYNGAWDYPANVRGYTYGGTIELNQKWWALRYGIFQEPAIANGAPMDPHILRANGQVLEFEDRYLLGDRPGKLRLLAYLNNAHMGSYREALAEMPVGPDITLSRAYRIKYGFGLNWEQELSDDVGVFGRLGWNDGQTESWAFTEIDSTASLGVLIKGCSWCRPGDRLGLALLANGLSNAHKDYLAAGGLGFIIGDGRLRYGPEEIVELFYNIEFRKGIYTTVDFQAVNNPGYNRDRGPVGILGVRVHFEY